MNSLAILGYVIAMCLAPVAPFIVVRWVRKVWHAAKALRVLSREQRTGESLYDCAEALAGDAHNWRGSCSPFGSCAGDIVDDNEELGLAAAVERIRAERIASTPQPSPQNSDGPALWPMIIAELGRSETDRLVALDMQQRHEFGMQKYGVPLVASNGRDHLADAYQEALDGVVYLRAEREALWNSSLTQPDDLSVRTLDRYRSVGQLYTDQLDMAKEIRELIRERDGR